MSAKKATPKKVPAKKGGANGYAALVKKRAADKAAGVKKPKRHALDAYETPAQHTRQLLENFPVPPGKTITEPAAGTGRMVRELKAAGFKVNAFDMRTGHDFTKRTKKIEGHCITNPPYRDGLADAFVNKALELTDGVVCMLMEAKYLFGSKRFDLLFGPIKPLRVIIIPERIYFFDGHGAKAKQIESQFYNHVWICWPDREYRMKRARSGGECEVIWAKPSPDVIDLEFG